MVTKVVLAVVALIAVAIGTVALVGSRLPVGHVATRSLVVPAPPDVVFQLISDVHAAPSWRTGVDSVVVEGDDRFTEISGSGRLAYRVTISVRPARLVSRIVEGGAFGGAWAYAIAAEGNGSRLTISEHGEVYNPIFRFVSAYLIGHTATLDRYLGDVARELGGEGKIETGQVVPPG